MSNGVKIGLLIVVAGVLGFLTYRLVKGNHEDNIGGRHVPQTTTAPGTPDAGTSEVKSATHGVGEASNNRPKTMMTFEMSEHDFGKMKQGDAAEYAFRFTNTGKEALIIEDAKGSCGCTVPSYPKEPVAPGATGEIKVKFNSAGKRGTQQKTVTLTANTDPISTVLTIRADVDVPADANQSAAMKKKS